MLYVKDSIRVSVCVREASQVEGVSGLATKRGYFTGTSVCLQFLV